MINNQQLIIHYVLSFNLFSNSALALVLLCGKHMLTPGRQLLFEFCICKTYFKTGNSILLFFKVEVTFPAEGFIFPFLSQQNQFARI